MSRAHITTKEPMSIGMGDVFTIAGVRAPDKRSRLVKAWHRLIRKPDPVMPLKEFKVVSSISGYDILRDEKLFRYDMDDGEPA